MKRSTLSASAAIFLFGASALGAQTAVSLTKPDATFPDPFTRPTSIRELPNGKVMVADLQDKVVQLVDFASKTAVKVGREGQGPGEYAFPSTLFPMPNGETWIYDIAARRFVTVDKDGKPGTTVSMPGSGGGIVAIGGGGGGGADASGRIYVQAPPFNPNNPGAPTPDSTAILRWDRVKTTFDTVAWLALPKGQFSASGGGGRFTMRIGGGKVFTPAEAWGVSGDGSIARVRPSPYQVLWYGPTAKPPAAGPVVPYTPIKVTDADKKQVIEEQKKAKPMMISIGGGGGRQTPPPNIQVPAPEFEETKPPYSGQGSVVVSPDAEVWVRRSQPAGEKNPAYDVFDRAGKVIRKVTLNPKSSVIGFGAGTVYVLRTDEEDLQYLERYRR